MEDFIMYSQLPRKVGWQIMKWSYAVSIYHKKYLPNYALFCLLLLLVLFFVVVVFVSLVNLKIPEEVEMREKLGYK